MQQGIKKLQWFEYLKVVFLKILNAELCWVFCKSGHNLHQTDIRHIKGEDNPVADTLSRLGAIHYNDCKSISFENIAAVQYDDSELIQLQSSPTSLKLHSISLPASKDIIICDLSTGVSRPFVLNKFRRTMFESLHSLSHPGIRVTQILVTDRYV